MKYATLAAFAAAAAAFVIPDDVMAQDLLLPSANHDTSDSWATDGQDMLLSVEEFVKQTASVIEHEINDVLDAFSGELDDINEQDRPRHGHHGGHHRHGDPNKTIYELVKESNYTKTFAKLVDEYDDIKALLDDSKKNHTLFVPLDSAFEHLPEHKKPSKDFVLGLLKYHVVPGSYPVGRVLASHTIPTELTLADLDNNPQRLRVSVSLFGVRLNLYSKVRAGNIVASNGVIHAVDKILMPPPAAAKLIKIFPSKFSTLALALETTGVGAALKDIETTGSTLFAPSNAAFAKLGPRLNAFLFSDHGKKYLAALLKYHVVANETLYSDAYYGKGKSSEGFDEEEDTTAGLRPPPSQTWHFDLPSLLNEKPIAVDVRRWMRWTTITVNKWVRVSLQDAVAEDGVIHVIENVLIPPHKHKKPDEEGDDYENDGISEEELKERLGDLVEDEKKNESWGDL
jgi:uncharacterized surface protein with fasciclin (FAS1) repeats